MKQRGWYTQRHFEDVARILNYHRQFMHRDAFDVLYEDFVETFKTHCNLTQNGNEAFDEDKFRKAVYGK